MLKNRTAFSAAGVARRHEQLKIKKYAELTRQQDAVFVPFAAETCGGLGPQALKLLKLISVRAIEHLSIWPHHDIVGHMLSSVAIAIQKGNSMTVLAGVSHATMRADEVRGSEKGGGEAA